MFSSLVRLVAVASTVLLSVSASPVELNRRAVINHDAVVGFPETVPSGDLGALYLKYKPFLKVFNGCVPFPAVDASGNTSDGLAPTGPPDGSCDKSTGQVYARSGSHNGLYAIMYSWYMPKDSPSSSLGHRHEWENVVVWLSSQSLSATIHGVSISAHGRYQKTKYPHLASGTSRSLIGYISIFPINHQLIDTSEQGGEQPLIAWESLTSAARSAIQSTDWGAATPSFRDDNFESYLEDAAI
ncbi:necrosis-and ethylene-inducing protein-like protein 1 precursor [Delitschia confertaspora ATCC 74209]|uniref:Necrosis-and ethylene-inducing protein-like protein 1 n=1 Tax=Delitschia confertaspora ATCC 74209 TaxID=1513339 RepID=A0A9P4JQ04_9PLEO|nr:necrosis-and ethylene-inducing protein-like protein 1 precursor [Delitschia confertaspora ATCC 74209]